MPTTRLRTKRVCRRDLLGEVRALWNAGSPPPPRTLTAAELDWLFALYFFEDDGAGDRDAKTHPFLTRWLDQGRAS